MLLDLFKLVAACVHVAKQLEVLQRYPGVEERETAIVLELEISQVQPCMKNGFGGFPIPSKNNFRRGFSAGGPRASLIPT